MKRPQPAGVIPTLLIAALLGGLAGCSRTEADAPRALAGIDGGKVVVAGARPRFRANVAPVADGFLEELRWDPNKQTLDLKGWAPLDVRPDAVRFVLRDPFDRLRLEGQPTFAAQPRTDVERARPQWTGILHSGFTASLKVSNPPRRLTWPEALEVYCVTSSGGFMRLHRADAPGRQSWDRRPDRFEVALIYAQPDLATPEKKVGSLDLCEPAGDNGVRLAGWAMFDGQSPNSVLMVQLPPSAAPATIVACSWVPRPDVRLAVAPARAELERSGFDLTLQLRTSTTEMRKSGRLRLWVIDASQTVSEVALTALRDK